MTKRPLCVAATVLLGFACRGDQTESSLASRTEAYLERVIPQLYDGQDALSAVPPAAGKPEVRIKDSYRGKLAFVDARLHVRHDLANGKVLGVNNPHLSQIAKTNTVQIVPKLSVPEAVGRARRYLEILGVSIPPHMRLSEVNFNLEFRSCWGITWEPAFNGHAYDNFVTPYAQSCCVVFHETLGYLNFGLSDTWPPPASSEVNVTKEAAILKAAKAVPLIQRSPYYLQARRPGHVVSAVYRAELLVSAPNWLLDPERVIWLWEKPPEETRLCWVVTFGSVYTGKTDPDELLVPQLFLVYIDAATGEIVGAQFT